jgi:hypothetical protein
VPALLSESHRRAPHKFAAHMGWPSRSGSVTQRTPAWAQPIRSA